MQILQKILLLVLLTILPLSLKAQDEESHFSEPGQKENAQNPGKEEANKQPEKIYLSRMRNVFINGELGDKTAAAPDTLPLNFQNMAFPERNQTLSAEHLSNLGNPFQSNIFRDRTQKTPFLFGRVYDQWLTANNEQIYYNTTTPYTNIRYLTTFGNDVSQEENFKFLFTVNLNKHLNIGADYEILYARGFYNHNSNRNKIGSVFGNYQSPRYEAFWRFSFNYMENFENGGITNDLYITDPMKMSGGLSEYESLNIPVGMTDAKSLYRSTQAFFHHKFNLGFERMTLLAKDTSKTKDSQVKNTQASIDTAYVFVPVTSFFHTFTADFGKRSFKSSSANTDYFKNTYLTTDATQDSCSMMQIRNTVGIALVEGFHPWAKFGLSAFAESDLRRYSRMNQPVGILSFGSLPLPYSPSFNQHDENQIWAGGEISRKQGRLLTFSALAKLCVLGYRLGDFELKGNLQTTFDLWRQPVSLRADASFKNSHPDYFMEHYVSNHFIWNNNFDNENRTMLRGSLDIPALGFTADGSVENINNYLYYNNSATPDQYSGNIQVITLTAKQHLRAGILNWDNHAAWQLSSNKKIIPLPDLSVYSDLYLKFMLSGVLTTHLGVDCRYNTAFYSQAYMPATGVFYNQQSIKTGNYPFMNGYANFHLKRMRFFVMYSHLSRFFVSPNYFSAPHYPLNPAIIKAGLSWNFYD